MMILNINIFFIKFYIIINFINNNSIYLYKAYDKKIKFVINYYEESYNI